MNIRESILIKLEEDLPDLQSLNGYELNYNTIVKGYISVSDCKNFPTVCYDLSSVSSASAGETVQQNLNTSRLIIWIYVSEFKEKGKVMNIREQAISDITKFVMQDTSVTHCLRLDEVLSSEGAGITDWNIDIEHSTDYAEGKAVIQATINISYYEFHTQQNNYQNV